tara:strand:- start:64 stop:270 length:207 start_codon:yes stop_codon:yes gene_type:complete
MVPVTVLAEFSEVTAVPPCRKAIVRSFEGSEIASDNSLPLALAPSKVNIVEPVIFPPCPHYLLLKRLN